jgi:G6PDH family F420-dependent oxidoreductase
LNTSSPLKFSLAFSEIEGDPTTVRDTIILADKLGFDGAWVADHFMPWLHAGNQSPFAWSLMASCLESTRNISVGPCVTTPIGGRYHPAVIAQASATLENMYPGRFRLSVGTGEAVNEARFPLGWPPMKERAERLTEGVQMIKNLWSRGEYLDFNGKYFPMEKVFLYTKPKQIPPIYFSSLGPKSAFLAGQSGDNLLTLIINVSDVGNTFQKCKDVIFPTFDAGVRSAGGDISSRQKCLSLSLGFEGREKYLANMKSSEGLYAKGAFDEPDPRVMGSRKFGTVTDDGILENVLFCSSWEVAVDVVKKIEEMGATEVSFYAGTDPDVIRQYAEKLLPHFRN